MREDEKYPASFARWPIVGRILARRHRLPGPFAVLTERLSEQQADRQPQQPAAYAPNATIARVNPGQDPPATAVTLASDAPPAGVHVQTRGSAWIIDKASRFFAALLRLRWPEGGFRGAWSRLSLKWRLVLAVPLAGLSLMVASLAAIMVYYTIAYPHPLAIRATDEAKIRILGRDGSVIAERGGVSSYTPVSELPRYLQAAVVATEDRRFFDHVGLDPVGLVRAVFVNLRAARFVQGGSTLTQQLAKNLFLSPERTLSRKVEELALSLWLELRLSKSEILELYLNSVYFGAGAYGVEAASQKYFDRPARDLTLPQSAVIAGLLRAPSRYSPLRNPALARARGRIVIKAMRDAGYISPREAETALADRIVFSPGKSSATNVLANHAIDFVLDNLPPHGQRRPREIIIETTLDANLQRRAAELLRQTLERDGPALRAGEGAVVVLDHDGGIRAMVGGRDYAKSQFNRATSARRQPGSVFKPIVYVAALDDGLSPTSPVVDSAVSYDGWSPGNNSGRFVGLTDLRTAMAQSINTVAAALHMAATPARTIANARKMGIVSPLREDASLALGTSEVTPIEIAAAYTTLGNGGYAVVPHIIRRVRTGEGETLFTYPAPNRTPVISRRTVGEMNELLAAAVTDGTGKRAALGGYEVAGKTGTSQDYRDAWFAGYSSYLTAAVWIGNDNGAPMRKAVGGGLPADLWRRVMSAAHEGYAPLPLPRWPAVAHANDAQQFGPVAAEIAQQVSAFRVGRLSDGAVQAQHGVVPTAPSRGIPHDFIAKAIADTVGDGRRLSGIVPGAAPASLPR